jgi:hypothetical protein
MKKISMNTIRVTVDQQELLSARPGDTLSIIRTLSVECSNGQKVTYTQPTIKLVLEEKS